DPAEDVEEDRTNLAVASDHGQRVDDALRVAAPAEVAEVRRLPAGDDDHVDRRHRQAGSVAEDADTAIELHVRHALLPRERLEWTGSSHVAHLGHVRMPEG